MTDTYKIEKFPHPKPGEYEVLGYPLGALIDGDDNYSAKIHFHFERRGVKTIFVLEDTDESSYIIDQITSHLRVQFLAQSRDGTLDVKLIVKNEDGHLNIDFP